MRIGLGVAQDEKSRSIDEDWLLTTIAIAVSVVVVLGAGPAWNEEANAGRRPGMTAFAVVVSGATLAFGFRTARRTVRRSRHDIAVCRFEKMPTARRPVRCRMTR